MSKTFNINQKLRIELFIVIILPQQLKFLWILSKIKFKYFFKYNTNQILEIFDLILLFCLNFKLLFKIYKVYMLKGLNI